MRTAVKICLARNIFISMLLADRRFPDCLVLRFGAHTLLMLQSRPFETEGSRAVKLK